MEYANGYLEVIIGPMFSGKTSKLLEIYKQYTFCNIPFLVVNHSDDVRYKEANQMVTHDQQSIPCTNCVNLHDLWEKQPSLQDSSQLQAILINEGQFFDDLYDFVCTLLVHKKHVYVCGLDGDFQRKKFGSILDLIPLCDNVYKLHSLCVQCKNGTKAIFSHRISHQNTTQKEVGASESYVPLCRKCYVDATQ
jgi:thymidine kinase